MSHTHHAAKVSHVPVLPATVLLAIPSLPHSSLPSLFTIRRQRRMKGGMEGGGGGQKSTVKTLNCICIHMQLQGYTPALGVLHTILKSRHITESNASRILRNFDFKIQ